MENNNMHITNRRNKRPKFRYILCRFNVWNLIMYEHLHIIGTRTQFLGVIIDNRVFILLFSVRRTGRCCDRIDFEKSPDEPSDQSTNY